MPPRSPRCRRWACWCCNRCNPTAPTSTRSTPASTARATKARSTTWGAAFEDWRTADGTRLLWFVWLGERHGLPAVADGELRNALAWTVFQAEDALGTGETLPWEDWGVPIALVALNVDRIPQWFDRASVVRAGGRARDSRLHCGAARLPPRRACPRCGRRRSDNSRSRSPRSAARCRRPTSSPPASAASCRRWGCCPWTASIRPRTNRASSPARSTSTPCRCRWTSSTSRSAPAPASRR